ncbi:MAG: thioredoxin [Planctomycetota bacterium]
MSDSQPHVIDVSAANFAQDVVERSKDVPVLIDFWAEWCGPCKALGPLLERLAEEYAGRFILAKVDVDQEAELAGMFGIQSIPTVMLVSGGRQVDGFAGAMPEAELRRFLEPHLGGGSADPLEGPRALLADGQVAEALTALEGLYSDAPDDDATKLLLAEACLLSGDSARAESLLDLLSPSAADGAEARALRARLAMGAQGGGDLAELEQRVQDQPDDLTARIDLGRALAAQGRAEEGLEMILETIKVDREHDDQAARKTMVEVLDALGPDSDLAHDFRRRLQVAMYV